MSGDNSKLSIVSTSDSWMGVTDAQAEALKSLSEFGQTTVAEVGVLARYFGRVLGTIPEDSIGLFIGDPLHYVRTAIARKIDERITNALNRRKVLNTKPVSPSLAIPLLRAAYDEDRPELQDLWADLIAAAMDPYRADRIRFSFIETLKKFDPIDAVVLKTHAQNIPEASKPNARDGLAMYLGKGADEIELSVENLQFLRCFALFDPGQRHVFTVTNYGRALIRACSD